MKLLIDIPEHIYEHAKEWTEDSIDEGVAMRAIANGSPTRCKGMDEAEKERLIKKNILSIENRVRHAFNQGYEMGMKESRSGKSNKWIPVSKRLPEDSGYYLTTTMYGDVYCDYWAEIGFDRQETVIAWQPLPAPYKEA